MDKFEKHIIENRESFDSKEPSSSVWAKLEEELNGNLDGNSSKDKSGWIWKAAAVIFFALSVYLVLDKVAGSNSNVDPLWAEFQITEKYYTSLIDSKKSLVNSLSEPGTELSADFKTDLDELDSIYKELLGEYQSTGNEQVMDALIQNLRVRLNVLDDQLEILQNVKEFSNDAEETITI